MFLQTATEAVNKFMLPECNKNCNRLLSDGAEDSVTCTGFCTHGTCHSTMPACKLSANDSERKQWPCNSQNLNPPADIMSGERQTYTKCFSESFTPQIQVLN